MNTERILVWEGCNNVRDLGGLRTADGRTTRWGSVVRSDSPARLSAAGWATLYAYGIRTIVSLRTHGMDESEFVFTPPYADLRTLPVAIEDVTDREFVRLWASNELWSTPLYYQDAIRRWPARHAAAIATIGQAQPGGVLFHCVRGTDRTGIIALLLLTLVGVPLDEVIADYELSPDPEREPVLARHQSSVRAALQDAIAGLDVEAYLRRGGVSPDALAAVRARLVG
jgi:protein tyrosine/serine phosphatase